MSTPLTFNHRLRQLTLLGICLITQATLVMAGEQPRRLVTSGFECELKGAAIGSLSVAGSPLTMKPGAEVKIDHQKYPYLEPTGDIEEETGNFEVRSLPAESIEQTLEEIKRLKQEFPDLIRGFHLHLRFDKELLSGLDESEFRSWLSRVGDFIFAWRLENRNPFYALKSKTVNRIGPEEIFNRGTVRLLDFGTQWDIEIRGFMNDEVQIQKLALKLIQAIQNPDLIHGFQDFQTAQFIQKKFGEPRESRWLTAYSEYVLLTHQIPITQAEQNFLSRLARNSVHREDEILPGTDLTQAPYLRKEERSHLAEANRTFFASLHRESPHLRTLNFSNPALAQDKFRELLSQWARQAGITEIFERKILMSSAHKCELLLQ